MTAVPMRRPIFAASARRESGATVVPEPGIAPAAVVMPSTAATPAAPTARRRRSLMCCLLCVTKLPPYFESFGRECRDGVKLRLRELHVNSFGHQNGPDCRSFLAYVESNCHVSHPIVSVNRMNVCAAVA